MDEEKYRCVNTKCKKIITKSSAYMSKSDDNFDGRMIWCKTCVNNTYMSYWLKYGDVKKALWHTCRRYNIPFVEDKYSMAVTQIGEQDYGSEKILSYYMQKLYSLHYGGEICFDDGITNIGLNIGGIEIEGEENRIKKWGNYNTDELDFLDYELEDWQKTHTCDNKAELTLLKHICIKELEIRKMQADHQDTSKALKDLQDLMKTASVDPAKANAASAGKVVDAFGVWIKDIEDKRPAEWFEDQNKFKDMDGFGKYLQNYVVRPIKNFLTGSRDFLVDDTLDANLDTVDLGVSSGDDSDGHQL